MPLNRSSIIVGVKDPLPIINLPEGTMKVRLRMRFNCAAFAYIKTAEDFGKYMLQEAEGEPHYWKVVYPPVELYVKLTRWRLAEVDAPQPVL